MERKCPVCASTEIIFGQIRIKGQHIGADFIPDKQDSAWLLHSIPIKAYSCAKCGEVFGFKLADISDTLTAND